MKYSIFAHATKNGKHMVKEFGTLMERNVELEKLINEAKEKDLELQMNFIDRKDESIVLIVVVEK